MKYPKINFHTHTTFCDGNDSPEQIVQAAINQGIEILGFSGHSMFPFSGKWHIQSKEFDSYVKEIRSLQKEFSDKIKIFLGFEADYYPTLTIPDKNFYKEFNPDFLIGSVHYVATKKGHYSVDASTQRVKRGLEILYDGNTKQAVCEYFQAEREMLRLGNFEILGHADVIRKRNGELHFFDENETWYKDELKLTADEIAKSGVIVEVNTGAIARGVMNDFYPSEYFLEILQKKGVPVMVNSDAHDKNQLTFAFEKAYEFIKKAGYDEITYPENGKFVHVKI